MDILRSLLLAALSMSTAAAAPTPADWTTEQWQAIVVGAGPAGIIVADKLSAAGVKTLLLEQGGNSYGITGGQERPDWLANTNLSRVDVPGLYSSIFGGPSSLFCKPDVVSAYQACTVGGNSAINAGLYFQPPASDWDTYFPAGWNSQDVQPGIDKLLQREPAVTQYSQDSLYYLQSSYDAVRNWIVNAAGFSEVSFSSNPNNKDKVFGRPVYNFIHGQRGGPVRTYLQTALSRSNFVLQTNIRVKYILQTNGVASGLVADIGNGVIKTIALTTNGRVILSAGAIQSPQILMYSGIGPQDQLSKLSAASLTPYNSANWIIQSAVGQGLFDNPNTFIQLSAPSIQAYSYSYNSPIPADRDQFLSQRSGPYSFAGQTSVFWGYVSNSDGSRTGIQGTVGVGGYADYTNANTITLNIYGTSGLLSSGRVVLSDNGKFTGSPSGGIYYSNPRDADNIASFIYSIFQALPPSTPSSPATNGLTPLNIPRNSTLAQIRSYITTWSPYAVGSVQHWSSSCRIGQCVDTNTKVIGTENIHVIDASILSPMTVNPQFAVMVVSETGTDKLLNSWTR